MVSLAESPPDSAASLMLVEIAPPAFAIEREIAYATAENFTGKPIYRRAGCYLHPLAAERLAAAIELAAALDLRCRIFDAYRPPEAQWVMWRHTPDPEFLADPRRGSPHSRGVALDLTLLRADGQALDMGTGFDAFTPLSHHGSRAISAEAQRNRHLLLGLMTAAGWDFYRNEWWHYQLFAAGQFPLIADGALAAAMM
jgi:D-alanyl-D-alanine dipeptidase